MKKHHLLVSKIWLVASFGLVVPSIIFFLEGTLGVSHPSKMEFNKMMQVVMSIQMSLGVVAGMSALHSIWIKHITWLLVASSIAVAVFSVGSVIYMSDEVDVRAPLLAVYSSVPVAIAVAMSCVTCWVKGMERKAGQVAP